MRRYQRILDQVPVVLVAGVWLALFYVNMFLVRRGRR